MRTQLKLFSALTAILMFIQIAHATEITARVKNYDRWKELPGEQLIVMSKQFKEKQKIDSALLCSNIVANRLYVDYNNDKNTELLAAKAMNILGIIFTIYYVDYEKAHRYLLQAKEIAANNNDLSLLAAVYANLANLYLIDCSYSNEGKLNKQTIEYHLKAYQTAFESNTPKNIISTAFNLAHIADDEEYGKLLNESLNQFLAYQLPDSLADYTFIKIYCQAVHEYHNGSIPVALSMCDKALNVMCEKDIDNVIFKYNILLSKCNMLLKQHRINEGVTILNKCLAFGDSTNDHHLLYITYETLSKCYYEKNDSVQGGKYELLAFREKDIVQNNNKLLDAEKTEFLFQLDKINADIIEIQARHKISKIIAWGSTTFAIVILLILCLLWRKYRQVKEKNSKLYENTLSLLAAGEQRRQLILSDAQTKKYQTHKMETNKQSDLLHRILYIMETSKEVYEDSFSLDRLTTLVDAVSRNYVSQVLNEHYKCSFPTLLNEYRIREACRRINNPQQYGHITNEAIAQSVGFRSYPNFVSNFKKFTGLTPSAYRKQSKSHGQHH